MAHERAPLGQRPQRLPPHQTFQAAAVEALYRERFAATSRLAFLLTGAFYVEVIYNWPGLGSFTVRSFLNLDYPAILGMTLYGAAGYVLVNLVIDLLYTVLDPRIRY